jgi:hypothetical protein
LVLIDDDELFDGNALSRRNVLESHLGFSGIVGVGVGRGMTGVAMGE